MNAYEELQNYLAGEHGIDTEPESDDEDNDCQLKDLILAYGQEQRKEGYIKGFEDGEAEAELLHNRDNM